MWLHLLYWLISLEALVSESFDGFFGRCFWACQSIKDLAVSFWLFTLYIRYWICDCSLVPSCPFKHSLFYIFHRSQAIWVAVHLDDKALVSSVCNQCSHLFWEESIGLGSIPVGAVVWAIAFLFFCAWQHSLTFLGRLVWPCGTG